MKKKHCKELKQVSVDEFNNVFEIIKEIGVQERHFNNMCGKYKSLASTWLLSTFAAIGFLLISNVEPKALFISAIAFAGSLGIFLLWLIDLKVYQQLLGANFVEGLSIEKKIDWLPKIRQNIFNTQKTGSVISNLSWFYIIGIEILFLIGIYSLSVFIIVYSLYLSVFLWIVFSFLSVYFLKKLLNATDEKSLKKYLSNIHNPVKSFKYIFWVLGFFVFSGFFILNINSLKSYLIQIETNNTEFSIIDSLNKDSNTELRDVKISTKIFQNSDTTYSYKSGAFDEIWFISSGVGKIEYIAVGAKKFIDVKHGMIVNIPLLTSLKISKSSKDALECVVIYERRNKSIVKSDENKKRLPNIISYTQIGPAALMKEY